MKATRADVFLAINGERDYQDNKWGDLSQHPHEVGAWLTVLRSELREAEEAWARSKGDENALREILQVASVAVACLEQHGIVRREPPSIDEPSRFAGDGCKDATGY